MSTEAEQVNISAEQSTGDANGSNNSGTPKGKRAPRGRRGEGSGSNNNNTDNSEKKPKEGRAKKEKAVVDPNSPIQREKELLNQLRNDSKKIDQLHREREEVLSSGQRDELDKLLKPFDTQLDKLIATLDKTSLKISSKQNEAKIKAYNKRDAHEQLDILGMELGLLKEKKSKYSRGLGDYDHKIKAIKSQANSVKAKLQYATAEAYDKDIQDINAKIRSSKKLAQVSLDDLTRRIEILQQEKEKLSIYTGLMKDAQDVEQAKQEANKGILDISKEIEEKQAQQEKLRARIGELKQAKSDEGIDEGKKAREETLEKIDQLRKERKAIRAKYFEDNQEVRAKDDKIKSEINSLKEHKKEVSQQLAEVRSQIKSEKVEFDTKQFAGILGRGGANVHKIRDSTGADVNVSEERGVITVRGSAEEIKNALIQVEELLASVRETVQVKIRAELLGGLIGKGGATIGKLQEDSGADIRVDKKTNQVSIRGNKEQIAKAQQLIDEFLKENQRVELRIDPGIATLILGPKGSNIKQISKETEARLRMDKSNKFVIIEGSKDSINAAKEKITGFINSMNANKVELKVASEQIGALIGKGGETLKKIQEESGAHITLDKKDGSLSLRGSLESVEKARVEFEEILKQNPVKDSTEIPVDSDMLGALIGKGGETIKKIQEESGAEVRIERRNGTVKISSSNKDAIMKATLMVRETLKTASSQANNGWDMVEVEPARLIGSLFKHANDIQKETNTKIKLMRDDGFVGYKGEPADIAQAKARVNEILEAERARIGSSSGERRGDNNNNNRRTRREEREETPVVEEVKEEAVTKKESTTTERTVPGFQFVNPGEAKRMLNRKAGASKK